MNGIILSSIVENVSTRRDGTIKVTLGCQEMPASRAGELMSFNGKLAACYLSIKDTIPQKDMSQVDAIEVDMSGKRPSERMRNVLFILWKQDQEGYKEFDFYYRAKMESFIETLKANIVN